MSNINNSRNVGSKDLIDTATANGSFNALGKALGEAQLTNVLKGAGPYTVFAPTDEAFEKLPKNALSTWLKPENKAELISVLKYHVLPGRSAAADVERLTASKMMQGQTAAITKDGDKLRIGGATVTTSDITSSNGIIHAIDMVNVPTKQ